MSAGDSRLNDRPRQAVALAYGTRETQGGLAPRVVATGLGITAQAIIDRARQFGVPIHSSKDLVEALIGLDLDQHIPPALYLAVAEVLAWIQRMESQAAASPQSERSLRRY